jgi:hypothetical protein
VIRKLPAPGDLVEAVTDPEGRWWWFVRPPGAPLDGSSIKAAHDEGRLHGPFRTKEETRADAFPDHKHTDAGVWDPAWEKKQ